MMTRLVCPMVCLLVSLSSPARAAEGQASAAGRTLVRIGKWILAQIPAYAAGKALDAVLGLEHEQELRELRLRLQRQAQQTAEDREATAKQLEVIRSQLDALRELREPGLGTGDLNQIERRMSRDVSTVMGILEDHERRITTLEGRMSTMEGSTAGSDEVAPRPGSVIRSGAVVLRHSPQMGPLGFSFATGKQAPARGGDIGIMESLGGGPGSIYGQTEGVTLVDLGPVPISRAGPCPQRGYRFSVPRIEGHTYCVSINEGRFMAKLEILQLIPEDNGGWFHAVSLRYRLEVAQ